MKNKAIEILKQLGGNKFIMMTGAKNFMIDNKTNSLTFQLPKKTYCEITITGADLYDMKVFKMTNDFVKKDIREASGLYCDMLQDMFTVLTGLDTHL
jgi:hypothetical protein